MSSRNFMQRMSTSGRLDAGVYKCDVVYINPANEKQLSDELSKRVQAFAADLSGVLDSRVVDYPNPSTIRYSETYSFPDKDPMFRFAQGVGYPQSSRALEFLPNYTSLHALL